MNSNDRISDIQQDYDYDIHGCRLDLRSVSILPANEKSDSITEGLREIKERSRGTMRFDNYLIKKLGASYLLLSVAETSGLREDLHQSFGKYGDWILSMAVTEIRGAVDDDGNPDLTSNMSRELLGIIDSMEPGLGLKYLGRLGRLGEPLEDLFRRRIARSSSVMVADTPYIGEFGDMDAKDDEPGFWVTCDDSGIPVHCLSGTMKELREYGFDRYQNEICNLGAGARTFILEKRTGNADLYDRLIERGSRFISVSKTGTPCTLDAADRLRTMGSVHKRNDSSYSVYSTGVAVVSRRIREEPENPEESDCTATLDVVTDTDPRYRESPPKHRFTMWVFNRNEEDGISRERMERKISVIERRLHSLGPEEAMKQFEETAGSLARFFRISVREGELNLEVRQKELDMYLDHTPDVYFSYGYGSWEKMMDTFDSRLRFETAMSALHGQLRKKHSLPEPDQDLGRTQVIRFVALVLWCLTARKLEAAGIDEDTGKVLDRMDTIRAVGDGVNWRVLGLTPRNRSVMVRLGIQHPGNSMCTLPYDYSPRRRYIG